MGLKDDIKNKSIDLNQYDVIKNIDKMIALNLEANKKLEQLKDALFLQKLTNEEKIFIVENKTEKFYLSEENFNSLRYRIESYSSGFSSECFDVAKFRLKKMEI